MTIIKDKITSYKPSGDRFFLYALERLRKTEYVMNSLAYFHLKQIITRGGRKFRISRTQNVGGRKIHGVRRNYPSFKNPARVSSYYVSIDKLINGIITYKRIHNKNSEISRNDILMGLKSVCPLWPFC